MSGIPQFNFPEFDKLAAWLRGRGFGIISPAEIDDPAVREQCLQSEDGLTQVGQTWGECLARDVQIVADLVDGVILMPGWENSRGARLEAYTAFLSKKALYIITDDLGHGDRMVLPVTGDYLKVFL
jgi:hypothetical protein